MPDAAGYHSLVEGELRVTAVNPPHGKSKISKIPNFKKKLSKKFLKSLSKRYIISLNNLSISSKIYDSVYLKRCKNIIFNNEI